MAKVANGCVGKALAGHVAPVSYVEKMDTYIKQLREEEGLVSMRFCAFGKAGPKHRERMAKVFCTLVDLEREGLLQRAYNTL